jgi:hypothetical protein
VIVLEEGLAVAALVVVEVRLFKDLRLDGRVWWRLVYSVSITAQYSESDQNNTWVHTVGL